MSILSRIHKLQTLADDERAPPGERQAALERIDALCKKYKITLEDFELEIIHEMYNFEPPINTDWQVLIARAITDHYECQILDARNEDFTLIGLMFVGERFSVNLVKWMFTNIMKQIDPMMKDLYTQINEERSIQAYGKSGVNTLPPKSSEQWKYYENSFGAGVANGLLQFLSIIPKEIEDNPEEPVNETPIEETKTEIKTNPYVKVENALTIIESEKIEEELPKDKHEVEKNYIKEELKLEIEPENSDPKKNYQPQTSFERNMFNRGIFAFTQIKIEYKKKKKRKKKHR